MAKGRVMLGLVLVAVVVLLAVTVQAGSQAALGTGFTYQGRLATGGTPVSGDCDFRFGLWDATLGGGQLGLTQTLSAVPLADGYFTVQLNDGSEFGASAFQGDQRYLAVEVRCPAGGGTYASLGRQALTATPYAHYALGAPWDGLAGVPADLADGDADTTYTPGPGLDLAGTEFSADEAYLQRRVGSACDPGSSIRLIRQDGTVDCEPDDLGSGSGGGDITAVIAGTGLTGGGLTGTVTLHADFGGTGDALTVAHSDHDHDGTYSPASHDHDSRYYTESEVSMSGGGGFVHWDNLTAVPTYLSDGDDDTLAALSCDSGEVPKWIAEAWTCANDLDTGTEYSAGFGLDLSGTEFSVVTSTIQQRVSGTCPPGQSIRLIDEHGTVTCEDDDNTTYSAGAGLDLAGTQFLADPTYLQRRVGSSCAPGSSIRVIHEDGTVDCEPDDLGTSGGGGDITGVIAGTGLEGGGLTGTVTLNVDFGGSGEASTAARSDHDHDGTYSPASHDHDLRYYTESELNASGGGGFVHWDNLTSVPPGLADGDDDSDTLATLTCSSGQVAKWMAEAWTCASDADTDTTYSAGNQLELYGTVFDVLEGQDSGLDADLLDGEDSWYYRDWANLFGVPPGLEDGDDDTTYSPGTQLSLDGTTFNVLHGDGSGLDADFLDGLESSHYLDWLNLTGVPSGLDDGDDDTTYSPGTQLSLVGTTFHVEEGSGSGLDADLLDGQDGGYYLEWANLVDVPFGLDNGDDDTTYSAGSGLALTVTTFSLLGSYQLPQDCDSGQITEWDGDSWECGTDDSGAQGEFWSLNGNAGTTPGTHFLGTTDGVSLTLAVSGTPALRLVPGFFAPSLIGGAPGNSLGADVEGATIGGGGSVFAPHSATASFATIGGGEGDIASGFGSTVAGGSYSVASADFATIGGGVAQTASGGYSSIGGGSQNQALASFATIAGGGDEDSALGNLVTDGWGTVGGGRNNQAGDAGGDATSAQYATVSGGRDNTAAGTSSTIGGGENISTTANYATVGGGQHITVTGSYATVAGGQHITVTHHAATVGGGQNHTASGDHATISGGFGNYALAGWPTIGGGWKNRADDGSVVGGGSYNSATGAASVIAGGDYNSASNFYGVIGGGFSNSASGYWSTIGGGESISVTANYATVGGGQHITVTGSYATVAGGQRITVTHHGATVGGGQNHTASGDHATIGGGFGHYALAGWPTIGGGWKNRADDGSVVGGGSYNSATGTASVIAGGDYNSASNFYGVIGGGFSNSASGYWSTIGGGESISVTANYATVGGGQHITVTGTYATVAGGQRITVTHHAATVGGGQNHTASGEHATIAGGFGHYAAGGWPTIGGGWKNSAGDGAVVSGGMNNSATGDASVIAGGDNNSASNFYGVIGGGFSNSASGYWSTIGGGENITVTADYATVGGGEQNSVSGTGGTIAGGDANTEIGIYGAIGGGWENIVTKYGGVIPGGGSNEVRGDYGVAMGYNAHVLEGHRFSLVFGGSLTDNTESFGESTVTMRAAGGYKFYTNSSSTTHGAYLAPNASAWSTLSDRNAKHSFEQADSTAILDALAGVPIQEWSYVGSEVRHLGPVAQDFYAAFGLGDDERYISTVDTDGVALAAIQALHAQNQDLAAQNEVLHAENESQQAQLDDLEARLSALEAGRPSRGRSSAGGLLPWAGGLLFAVAGALTLGRDRLSSLLRGGGR